MPEETRDGIRGWHVVAAFLTLLVVVTGITQLYRGINKDATPTEPTTLPCHTAITISPSIFSISSGDTITITATLRDNAGNALTNKTIAWSASMGNLSANTASSDNNGRAAVTYTAPSATVQTQVWVCAAFAGDAKYYGAVASSAGVVTKQKK